ncbi:UNVERIFIED_CONTAM: hypothetical protein Sindi_1642900 [Sesamum indicum]
MVVFDIAEYKALEPDGYTSGFFKAAWSMVGPEVTQATLDFFCTSKLLKQVNATLLALIPKVDLRYDTVEGDLLLAAMRLFGFPGTFIGWIEEYITTPSYSVCLIGVAHGFFRGARGLRQGDPMSLVFICSCYGGASDAFTTTH